MFRRVKNCVFFLFIFLHASKNIFPMQFDFCEHDYNIACDILTNPLVASKKNIKEALNLLRKNHDLGHYLSSFSWSMILRNGLYCKPNYKLSTDIMISLADANYACAQYQLGFWYLLGEKVQKDNEKALIYLSAASINGFSESIFNLAFSFPREQYVIALKAASLACHKNAMLILGDYYFNNKLYDEAGEIWLQAYKLGIEESVERLGKFYNTIKEYKNSLYYYVLQYSMSPNAETAIHASIVAASAYEVTQEEDYLHAASYWHSVASSHGYYVVPSPSQYFSAAQALKASKQSSAPPMTTTLIDVKPSEISQSPKHEQEIAHLRDKALKAAGKKKNESAILLFENLFSYQQRNQTSYDLADLKIYARICSAHTHIPADLKILEALRDSKVPELNIEYQKLEFLRTTSPEHKAEIINKLVDYDEEDRQINKIITGAFLSNLYKPTNQGYKKIISYLTTAKKLSDKERSTLVQWYSAGVEGLERNLEEAYAHVRLLSKGKAKKIFALAQASHDDLIMARKIYEDIYESNDNNFDIYKNPAKCFLATKYIKGEIEESNTDKIYGWLNNFYDICSEFPPNTSNVIRDLALEMLEKAENFDERIVELLISAFIRGADFNKEVVDKITTPHAQIYFDNFLDYVLPAEGLRAFAEFVVQQEVLPELSDLSEYKLDFNLTDLAAAMLKRVENPTLIDHWAHNKYPIYLIFAAFCEVPYMRIKLGDELLKEDGFAFNPILAIDIFKQESLINSIQYHNLGRAYYLNKDYEQAEKCFSISFNNGVFESGVYLYVLALEKSTAENYDKALDLIEPILQFDYNKKPDEQKLNYIELSRILYAQICFIRAPELLNEQNTQLLVKNLAHAHSSAAKLLLAKYLFKHKRYLEAAQCVNYIIRQIAEPIIELQPGFNNTLREAQLLYSNLIIKSRVNVKNDAFKYAFALTRKLANIASYSAKINNFMFDIYNCQSEKLQTKELLLLKLSLRVAFEQQSDDLDYAVSIFDIVKLSGQDYVLAAKKVKDFVGAVLLSNKNKREKSFAVANKIAINNMIKYLIADIRNIIIINKDASKSDILALILKELEDLKNKTN